jgi:pentapeptide MXKDX repeat protein
MRNLASLLVGGSLILAASSVFGQNSTEENGITSDSMSKESAMGPQAKPTQKKKDHMGDSMGHDVKSKDPVGKDSMSKDSIKENPLGGKPTSM